MLLLASLIDDISQAGNYHMINAFWQNSYIGPDRQKSSIQLLIYPYPPVGCSKEPSHGDGSFEYSQHMFCFRNQKSNFHIRTLIWTS